MGMVYYDWNIDSLGHIWPGFVHYFIPKNGTEADAVLCPYIKTDLSMYDDAADDPSILKNTKFNDDGLQYCASASDGPDGQIAQLGLNDDSWKTKTPLKPGEVVTADVIYDPKDTYQCINDKRLTVVRLFPYNTPGQIDETQTPETGENPATAGDPTTENRIKYYYLHTYANNTLINAIRVDENGAPKPDPTTGQNVWLASADNMHAYNMFMCYFLTYQKDFIKYGLTVSYFAHWYDNLLNPNFPLATKQAIWLCLRSFYAWAYTTMNVVYGSGYMLPAELNVTNVNAAFTALSNYPMFNIYNNNAFNFLNTYYLNWNPTAKMQLFYVNGEWYRPIAATPGGVSYFVDNPVYVDQNNYFMQVRPHKSVTEISQCISYNQVVTYNMQKMVLYANMLPNKRPMVINTNDITAVLTSRTDEDNMALIYYDNQWAAVKANYTVMAKHWFTKQTVFIKSINIKPSLADDRNVDDILDEALNDPKNAWKTPKEYYAQGATTDTLPEGENGYLKSKVLINNNEDKMTKPVWWWSNTLANWCTFKRTTQYTTELFVWNGKNGWDKFDDIMKEPRYTGSSKVLYYYDITRFIKGPRMTSAIVHDSMRFDYKSIKMIHDTKFSHYDERNYQTVRLPKVHYASKGTDRYPNTIGIPVLCRLPSGEVEIFYTLKLPGMSKNVDVVRTDNIDFINSVCKAYFGDGDDKQIMTDWKRFYKIIASGDESATDIILDNESTLYDAEEINTIHTDMDKFSITLSVPRQYPETDEGTKGDYVERWES